MGSDDRQRAPSRTWRETAAQASDEVLAIRERVFHRHEVFYRDDAVVLLAEIDRLRSEVQGWAAFAVECQVQANAAAEDMRRRAAEVCRASRVKLEREQHMRPVCEASYWYGKAHGLSNVAVEIDALPLLADGETGE